MIGRLKDLVFGRNGEQIISLTVRADFAERFDELKDFDVDVEIKKHREPRSHSANAYFHVLISKIAKQLGLGDDEVKANLVIEYGELMRDMDGDIVCVTQPAKVNASAIYPYCRCYDIRYENGVEYRDYLLYKKTHEMDSKEMSRLIDGAIYEAKNLGIETDTPEQIARYKSLWASSEAKGKE